MISEITKQFLHNHPEECAREIENFSLEDILFFIKSLSAAHIAKIFSYLSPSISAACLEKLPEKSQQDIIQALSLNTLKIIIPRINKNLRAHLLEYLPRNTQIALEHVLNFAAQTVGAFMDTMVLFLPIQHNVKQALDLMRTFPNEVGSTIFCTDADDKLQGMISMKDLATATHDIQLLHLVKPCPLVLQTNTSLHSIATHTVWEQCTTLPVVDAHNILIGTLEYEKIVATIQNILFGQRSETLLDAVVDILVMFSNSTEDIVNELQQIISSSKGQT